MKRSLYLLLGYFAVSGLYALITGASFFGGSQCALACTGISLFTSNKDLVQARTIEWAESSLNSKLIVSPAGHSYASYMPDKTKGMTWKAKYGFVGISVTIDQFIGEGMNEKGMNAGIFYFKGFGSLAKYEPSKKSSTISDMDFIRWILTNFATVDEMLAQLPSISIAPVYIDPEGIPAPTGHWRISDKTGRNIVIEIINNGEVKVYENIGVLTNSPGYDWHLLNLSNYMNIQPGTIVSKKYGAYTAKSLGAGTAALGLPGDITPPSRFVRAAFYLFSAPTYANTFNCVQEAFHILNNFDIPIGCEFSADAHAHIPNIPSATQWTAVSDLSTLNFYFRTMYDPSIQCVHLPSTIGKVTTETYLPLDNGKCEAKPYAMPKK